MSWSAGGAEQGSTALANCSKSLVVPRCGTKEAGSGLQIDRAKSEM